MTIIQNASGATGVQAIGLLRVLRGHLPLRTGHLGFNPRQVSQSRPPEAEKRDTCRIDSGKGFHGPGADV